MTDLTPDLIRRAGLALYGPNWKAPLAALLNSAPRTISRIDAALIKGEAYDVNPAWAGPLKLALEGLPERRRQQEADARAVLEALAHVQPRPEDDPRERMRRSHLFRNSET